MNKLFESWRKYVNERDNVIQFPSSTPDEGTDVKDFLFTPQKLEQLNASMAKIVDAAKNILGAEGEAPYLTEEDFQEQEMRMVAEISKAELKRQKKAAREKAEEEFLSQYQKDLEGIQSITALPEDPLTADERAFVEKYWKELKINPKFKDAVNHGQLQLRITYFGRAGEQERAKKTRIARGMSSLKIGTVPLEKGLGRMTAADFETAEIVMPISEEVLKDFRVLVEKTKNTGTIYEEARDWYHNIRGLMDRETPTDRDATLLGLLIATYSPRAKFALNLAEAVFMYKAVQKDVSEGKEEQLRDYIHSFPKKEKGDKGSPRGFTKAHKVPNFALNLIAPNLAGERDEFGEIVYNDMYEWNSTIDTWMIDAFYPFLRKASTADEWSTIKGNLMSDVVSYRYMAHLVAQEAKKLKILPHELQAIIWVASQIRQTGKTSLGVTTQFAFNQIREAISNIHEINNGLKELSDLEKEGWLGTIIKTIDEKGFPEASQYILEPKKGVRSIAMSGKKGSEFKYFPGPPKKKKKNVEERIDKEGRAYIPKNQGKKNEYRVYYDPDKYETWFMDPKFSGLNTWYVMNNVIQMNAGKFSNLHDSILLYLDPDFSTDTAVQYILGRFDPEAKKPGKYFLKEIEKIAEELRRR